MDLRRVTSNTHQWRQAPDPTWTQPRDSHLTNGFRLNIGMACTTDLIYQRLAQYKVFHDIGIYPFTVLGYCTYSYWSDLIYTRTGYAQDDVSFGIEEDIMSLLDDPHARQRNYDDPRVAKYTAAVFELTNEALVPFRSEIDMFFSANRLYDNLTQSTDLHLDGLQGHVVNFTLGVS